MTEPILDTNYWKRRLEQAKRRHIHEAVFRTSLTNWQAIEEAHRKILAATIEPQDSVLDAGCGWGRLIDLLPQKWEGNYLGVDISPDMVELAQKEHPNNVFHVSDLITDQEFCESWVKAGFKFDWAIMISIRPMIKRNLSSEAWDRMEENLRICCDRLLFLEYDSEDLGEILK